MKKLNAKGFTVVEGLLIFVIIGIIGGVGWWVYSQNKTPKTLDSTNTTPSNQTKDKEQEEDKKVEAKTFSSFSVTSSPELKDKGSCKTGEILFAPIFNSDSFDYDCNSLDSALGYASIIFGESEKNVLELFDESNLKQSKVEISNSVEVTKYTFEAKQKGHGGGDFTARYVLYQLPVENGKFVYSIYWTGEGFSDEDAFLKEFNHLVLNNWIIK